MNSTNNQNPYILPGAIVIAAIVIAGAVIYGPKESPDSAAGPVPDNAAQGQQPGAPVVDAKNVDIKGSAFIGKQNAPITVVYWSDYQCPFCQKFDLESLDQIKKAYIDTGKVKFVFKDFQFLGPDSTSMAIVGRAVWDAYPDKYYDWREAMAKNQGEEHSGYATKEFIVRVTKTVPGIDTNKIYSLVDQNKAKYTAAIDADRNEGAKFGINGTPGFVAGNKYLSGAISFPSFSSTLDAQLK